MCPLRFLLAGLSALLALLVAFHLLSGPDSDTKPNTTGGQEKTTGQQKAEAKVRPAPIYLHVVYGEGVGSRREQATCCRDHTGVVILSCRGCSPQSIFHKAQAAQQVH